MIGRIYDPANYLTPTKSIYSCDQKNKGGDGIKSLSLSKNRKKYSKHSTPICSCKSPECICKSNNLDDFCDEFRKLFAKDDENQDIKSRVSEIPYYNSKDEAKDDDSGDDLYDVYEPLSLRVARLNNQSEDEKISPTNQNTSSLETPKPQKENHCSVLSKDPLTTITPVTSDIANNYNTEEKYHCVLNTSSDESADEKFEEFLSEVKLKVHKKPINKSPVHDFICDSSEEEGSSEDECYMYHKLLTQKECRPVLTTPVAQNVPENRQITKSNVMVKQQSASDNTLFLMSLDGRREGKVHTDAKLYVSSFKSKKQQLALILYSIFNQEVFSQQLPSDMEIKWNPRMTKTAGFCYYLMNNKHDCIRSARIELSSKVIDKADRLRDVLLHEMCHAAAWIVNNYRNGHGAVWKRWCVKAERAFPGLPPIERCHSYEISYKFTYKCMECGYSIGRHSKSIDITKKACGYCRGRFQIISNTPKKTSKPVTGFALYVKENYGAVKGSNKDLKHSEIMKLLSGKFADCKISS